MFTELLFSFALAQRTFILNCAQIVPLFCLFLSFSLLLCILSRACKSRKERVSRFLVDANSKVLDLVFPTLGCPNHDSIDLVVPLTWRKGNAISRKRPYGRKGDKRLPCVPWDACPQGKTTCDGLFLAAWFVAWENYCDWMTGILEEKAFFVSHNVVIEYNLSRVG